MGSTAPDFTLKTHSGEQFTLSSLRGRSGALLVFFATWCSYCMLEVPELVEFHRAYGHDGTPVYAINIKQNERVVDRFVKSKAVNYTVLLDTDAEVAMAYNVYGIPLIVGVDKNGVVRYRDHKLPRDRGALVKLLQQEGTQP